LSRERGTALEIAAMPNLSVAEPERLRKLSVMGTAGLAEQGQDETARASKGRRRITKFGPVVR
jgi:hypothetical protein